MAINRLAWNIVENFFPNAGNTTIRQCSVVTATVSLQNIFVMSAGSANLHLLVPSGNCAERFEVVMDTKPNPCILNYALYAGSCQRLPYSYCAESICGKKNIFQTFPVEISYDIISSHWFWWQISCLLTGKQIMRDHTEDKKQTKDRSGQKDAGRWCISKK